MALVKKGLFVPLFDFGGKDDEDCYQGNATAFLSDRSGGLKHYSELPQIREVDIREQRQVKRAIELDSGAEGKDAIELLERDLDPNVSGIKGVLKTIRESVFGEEE